MTTHCGPAVRLYVGGHAMYVQGAPYIVDGERMFSAAHRPTNIHRPGATTSALLDSGAFTDPPTRRLTPEQALERQLAWERTASAHWSMPFTVAGLVSYDLLIDETWIAGERHKRRWTVRDADRAVEKTIASARYLVSQRERLSPRTLILSCQGVDALQYTDCAVEVLRLAQPSDWLGLGGWCILGRYTTLLPVFWQTLYRVLPLASLAGLSHVHIFGVLYQPALGGLVWLADHYGLTVSTDSTAPVLACTWKDAKKSGRRRDHWKENVEWWRTTLANLRTSEHYRRPPDITPARQLELPWEVPA